MTERIAILGWGSLLWDPHPFDGRHHGWDRDGPVIPIEFSRVSRKRKNALTLVIDPEHGVPTRVAYALGKHESPEEAHRELMERERAAQTHEIGLLRRGSGDEPDPSQKAAAEIAAWAAEKEIDAVVWTNFPGDFHVRLGRKFSVAAAKEHLMGLSGAELEQAVTYIHRAPQFVRTPLRDALREDPWFRRLREDLGLI